jgi:hypothetical protein
LPVVLLAVELLVVDGWFAVDALVLLDSDWSPVVAVELVVDDWLPVLVEVSVLIDWLPVVVALSIVRLERPRKSMDGVKVELDPLMDEFTSVDEPVTALLALLAEPVTALLPEALAEFEVDGLLELVDAVGELEEGMLALLAPEVALLAPEVALLLAWESGMQSSCTGLDEWSLAAPVLLLASLPALGWFRLLHKGLLAEAVLPAEAVLLELAVADGWLAELALLAALLLSFAKARLAEPSRVARASALR